MTVNKERVQLFVDALRSGNFQQGQGMLRTRDDNYCCLGVACEVARLHGIGIEWEDKQSACKCDDCQGTRWGFDGSREALSKNVADWYGFNIDNRFSHDLRIGFDADGNILTAIRANDDYGWDFNQIADAVEKKYLKEES